MFGLGIVNPILELQRFSRTKDLWRCSCVSLPRDVLAVNFEVVDKAGPDFFVLDKDMRVSPVFHRPTRHERQTARADGKNHAAFKVADVQEVDRSKMPTANGVIVEDVD